MTTQKITLSAEDRNFIAEEMGKELFYSRRDANTTSVNGQRKTSNKIKFDRDRFRRLQTIFAAVELLTGIKPIERPVADYDSFMSRIGRSFEPVQETQPVQPASQADVPWDMNF